MKDPCMKNLLISTQFCMKLSYLRLSLPVVISSGLTIGVFHANSKAIFPQLALTENKSVLISCVDMILLNSGYFRDKVL